MSVCCNALKGGCGCHRGAKTEAAAIAAWNTRTVTVTGATSDGFHTFDELYDHRHVLMLALMRCTRGYSWFSRKHAEGSEWAGWFIAGISLPTGDITYHLPESLWATAISTGAEELSHGKPWDGHKSRDVVKRLEAFAFGSRA